MNDRTLIHEIQKGRRELLGTIIERYYGDIYRFCAYLTGSGQEAYDLAQETFCRFIRCVDGYRCRNLKAYLFAIARNVCMDYFRGQKAPLIALEEAEKLAGKDAGFERVETERTLFLQLQKINENQREAILLYYYEELKMQEIARITGASLSTVKSRIRQGLKRLRRICEEEGFTL